MIKSDVLIIGSGSTGVPLAYFCAKRGLKTVVLEKEASWGRGQNRAAIGGLRATHSDPAKIKISLDSINIIKDLQENHGINLEWREGGYLYAAYTAEHEKAFKDLLVIQKKSGLNISWISPERVNELTPGINMEGLRGGTFSPEDGFASTLIVNTTFHRLALQNGADFRFNENVVSMKIKNNKIESVKTDKDEYQATIVVNAAGIYAADIGKLAGVEIPVTPDCHEGGVTDPVEHFMDPMLIDIRTDEESGNYYFYQAATGQIVFCITPNPQIWGVNKNNTSWFLPHVLKRMVDLYPRLRNLKVRRTWRGMYPMTPDGFPIIGFTREVDNLMLDVGMCGQGFMLGPGTGKLLSKAIEKGSIPEEDKAIYDELSLYRKFDGVELLK